MLGWLVRSRSTPRIWSGAIVGLCVMALIVSCGAPGATPGGSGSQQFEVPTPTDQARDDRTHPPVVAPQVPASSQPFGLTIMGTSGPSLDPAVLARYSELIITAIVVEIQQPRWTTADGKRSTDPHEPGLIPSTVTIVTPVVLRLDAAPILNRTDIVFPDDQIVVDTMGGTIGEDSIRTNFYEEHFEIGERVLLALTSRDRSDPELPAGESSSHDGQWNVIAKYILHDDDMAETHDQFLRLDDLIDALESAQGT